MIRKHIAIFSITAAVWGLLLAATVDGQAPSAPADARIETAVRQALFRDRAVPESNLNVAVENGLVTLTGTVLDLLARDRARKAARSIRGVRAVIDRVAIAPADRSDDAMRRDIQSLLALDPAVESRDVEVTVTRGIAILEGEVTSLVEKRVAVAMAKNVRGLFDVVDRIAVDWQTPRNDADILADVERRLEIDVTVDDVLVNVAVAHGKVILSGVVGSLAEKARARQAAIVRGVRRVDTSGLKISPWTDEPLVGRRPPMLDDGQIRRAVQDALRIDPRIGDDTVTVQVLDGDVTLLGRVERYPEKIAAGDTAENCVGVRRVRNYLTVCPAVAVADEAIKAGIETVFTIDPWVARHRIDVVVRNGDVFLYGTVDDVFEQARAQYLAAMGPGVVTVKNRLAVRRAFEWRPDHEIREDIRNLLHWNPFVDASLIDVAVEDGVAVLRGKLDSWFTYRQALAEAWEASPRRVKVEISVR